MVSYNLLTGGIIIARLCQGATYCVGRHPDGNDIQLNPASISRYHAYLEVTAEGVLVEDLYSKNDTWVDEVSCRRHGKILAKDGSTIIFGSLVCRLEKTASQVA